MIEGLSHSGNNNAKTVEFFVLAMSAHDSFIHQTYARMILEAPTFKDGSGKGVCVFMMLHNKIFVLLRPWTPGELIISVLKLKLDNNIMFKWQ